ncbi:hypothetical protein Tco_0700216 [Tanacetum coccineum]
MNRLLSMFKTKPTRFKRYKSFFYELQGRYGYLFAHLRARFVMFIGSSQTSSIHKLQDQLYLAMKVKPQLQQQDIEIDAPPDGENSANGRRHQSYEAYVSGESSSGHTTPLVHSCQRDPEAQALSLINQDLLYFKKGNYGPEKIVLSLHKFPAIIFNDDDIEERTSRWPNYKNLNKNDIEDIYLLIMNGKVPIMLIPIAMVFKRLFIRSTVIWERVHGFQLRIESYQQKVNLTAPTMTFPGIEDHEMLHLSSCVTFICVIFELSVLKEVIRHEMPRDALDYVLDSTVKDITLLYIHSSILMTIYTMGSPGVEGAPNFAVHRSPTTYLTFEGTTNTNYVPGPRARAGTTFTIHIPFPEPCPPGNIPESDPEEEPRRMTREDPEEDQPTILADERDDNDQRIALSSCRACTVAYQLTRTHTLLTVTG